MPLASSRTARLSAIFLFLLLLATPAWAQRGAVTLPQNLGELVDEADLIVRGHVLSARVDPHPQLKELHTIVVTLQVEETLKGKAADTLAFRQFIWDVRDQFDVAGYRPGQHLLLLLIKPNAYGLSSPAGLEQGRFRILHDAEGNQFAVNGLGNASLLRGLAPRLKRGGVQLPSRLAGVLDQAGTGPISLDDLRTLIQQIVEAK